MLPLPSIFSIALQTFQFPCFVLQLHLCSFHCLITHNIEVFSNGKCFRIAVCLQEPKGLTSCKVFQDPPMKSTKKIIIIKKNCYNVLLKNKLL